MADLVALFTRYPEWVGEQAIALAKRESPKFVPSVPQVEEQAEKLITRTRTAATYAQQWDEQSRKQLEERDKIKNAEESLAHRNKIAERILGEYRAATQPPTKLIETADDVKAKFGVTDAQWDALPSLPEAPEYWLGLRKAAAKFVDPTQGNSPAE